MGIIFRPTCLPALLPCHFLAKLLQFVLIEINYLMNFEISVNNAKHTDFQQVSLLFVRDVRKAPNRGLASEIFRDAGFDETTTNI